MCTLSTSSHDVVRIQPRPLWIVEGLMVIRRPDDDGMFVERIRGDCIIVSTRSGIQIAIPLEYIRRYRSGELRLAKQFIGIVSWRHPDGEGTGWPGDDWAFHHHWI